MATALERGFARGQTMTHNASPDLVTMPVEQRDIGCIIGRGGNKIRQLEQDSGARIKINKRDATVTIYGSSDQLTAAQDLIYNLLEKPTFASR